MSPSRALRNGASKFGGSFWKRGQWNLVTPAANDASRKNAINCTHGEGTIVLCSVFQHSRVVEGPHRDSCAIDALNARQKCEAATIAPIGMHVRDK